ncbi:MAG: winged helix-turn-helix domain-containing protein, partial [Sphingobacteriaceae bacterium]
SDLKPHYSLDEDGKWWVYIRTNDKSMLASKIVVDVLKRSNNDNGVLIEYSSKERGLLEYLQTNERITVKQYCDLLNLSRRRAQRILVNLVLSGVIIVHTNEKEEYYTAA